jgi:hypothetical protein
MFPIHLKTAEVARAALAHYKDGTLIAQFEPGVRCLMGPRGSVDPIGAALSQEQADAVRAKGFNGADVLTLARKSIVHSDDYTPLAAMQQAHDHWSMRAKGGKAGAHFAEAEFLALVKAYARPTDHDSRIPEAL